MKLSNQAMGALMMALQKCLMEETDIIELLRDMNFVVANDELTILNPPIVSLEGVTFDNVADLAEYAMNDEETSDEEVL